MGKKERNKNLDWQIQICKRDIYCKPFFSEMCWLLILRASISSKYDFKSEVEFFLVTCHSSNLWLIKSRISVRADYWASLSSLWAFYPLCLSIKLFILIFFRKCNGTHVVERSFKTFWFSFKFFNWMCRFEVLDEEPGDDEEGGGQRYMPF